MSQPQNPNNKILNKKNYGERKKAKITSNIQIGREKCSCQTLNNRTNKRTVDLISKKFGLLLLNTPLTHTKAKTSAPHNKQNQQMFVCESSP